MTEDKLSEIWERRFWDASAEGHSDPDAEATRYVNAIRHRDRLRTVRRPYGTWGKGA